jgi:hypothetical protein
VPGRPIFEVDRDDRAARDAGGRLLEARQEVRSQLRSSSPLQAARATVIATHASGPAICFMRSVERGEHFGGHQPNTSACCPLWSDPADQPNRPVSVNAIGHPMP